MTDKEQLSALIDNETSDPTLLAQLNDDEGMSGQWQRYHLIGDVMRGETAAQVDLDISASIAAAIEQEPVHQVMPEPQQAENDPSFWQRRVVPVFRHVGQYAIAASVAVAVIGGVQLQTAQQAESPLPVVNTVPVIGPASPVSLQQRTPAPEAQPVKLTDEQVQEQRQRINSFLLDHRLQQRIQPEQLEQ